MDSIRRLLSRLARRANGEEGKAVVPEEPVHELDDSTEEKETATILFNGGRAPRQRGDAGAIPLLRRCLEIRERLLSEDDPLLAPARNELGLALKEAGGLEEASDLFLKAHTYFARCHGEVHADYANTLHNYAATLLQRGQYEEGLAHMRRALDVREREGNAAPLDLSNTCWILGSSIPGQESVALLERALRERARVGETSGKSVAAIWRQLATAFAAQRQHLLAMAARRYAARTYLGAAASEQSEVACVPLDAVEALKHASVELRYGVISEANAIDLGVELVRDGGPLEADDAVMELACLDTRLDGDCARAPFVLDRALEVHAPGWSVEAGGHEIAQLVLNLAAQRFLEEKGTNPSSNDETDGLTGNSVRPVADLVAAMHADFGRQIWLEYFRVGGASGTALSFREQLREACRIYLADGWAAKNLPLAGEAGRRMTARAERRLAFQAEQAEREGALKRASEEFDRGRAALREERPGAETALRAAVSIFERWLPESRWTATARNELGIVLKAKGQLQEAAGLFRKAHDYFMVHHEEADPDTATTMHNLGATLSELGELESGGELLERALELQLSYRRTTMVDIANNHATLGVNLHKRGQLVESRKMLEEALALREQGHCTGMTAIADTCADLSEVTKKLGDYAAAEVHARRVVAVRSEALGHFHRDTADAMNQVGVVLSHQNRLQEAEQCFRQALSRFQEQAGQQDPFAINARINLGYVLLKRMEVYEALEVIQHAVALSERGLEPGHEYTARALSLLGDTFRVLRRYAEAIPPLTRARDIYESRYGRDHLKTADCANTLGLVFQNCGALEEAERMLAQAEETFFRKLGAVHKDTLTAKCNRAHVVYLRGGVAEAEQLWTEVIEAGENGEAAYRLGESLQARGDSAAAKARYLEALEIYERQLGGGSWHVAFVSEALGRLQRKSGQADDAERSFGRAWSIYTQLYGLLHDDTNRALSDLIEMVAARDLDLAIGIANTSISDIEGNSPEAVIAIAKLAVQLGDLLRRAGRLADAAKIFSSVVSGRSDAIRFDSELAVSAALKLAEVQGLLHEDDALLQTLQQALARCDEEPNSDESAAAKLCNMLARELSRVDRTQEAATVAHRAWTFYRPIEHEALAAAFAFSVYWRTALAHRLGAQSFWPPDSQPRTESDDWLLRIQFAPHSAGELEPVVESILRVPPGKVRLAPAPTGPSRLCRTNPTSILYAEANQPEAFLELAGSELILCSGAGASEGALALQADLVRALAEYPRLKWKRWTLCRTASGREVVEAEGTDGAELIARGR